MLSVLVSAIFLPILLSVSEAYIWYEGFIKKGKDLPDVPHIVREERKEILPPVAILLSQFINILVLQYSQSLWNVARGTDTSAL